MEPEESLEAQKERAASQGSSGSGNLASTGMELEFVQGVRMGEKGARDVLEVALKKNVALSVHAPYYINLNSYDKEKIKASLERIYQTARIGSLCGAESIVFHAAFYQKSSKQDTYKKVSETLKELTGRLRDEGIPAVLRPEDHGQTYSVWNP